MKQYFVLCLIVCAHAQSTTNTINNATKVSPLPSLDDLLSQYITANPTVAMNILEDMFQCVSVVHIMSNNTQSFEESVKAVGQELNRCSNRMLNHVMEFTKSAPEPLQQLIEYSRNELKRLREPSQTGPHGSRPLAPGPVSVINTRYTQPFSIPESSAMRTSFDGRILEKFVPLMVTTAAFLGVSVIMFRIPLPHLVEWESEKVYMRFRGEFSRFWSAAASFPALVRSRWVGQMCMMGEAFVPKDIPVEIDPLMNFPEAEQPKDPEPEPQRKIEEPKTAKNAFPGVTPVSLNGVIPPTFAPAKNDLLKGNLQKMFDLYRESKATTLQHSTFLQLSDPKDGIDDLAQFSQPHSKLKETAASCWDRLKDLVLNERDLRGWRLSVQRALKALALFLLALGVLASLSLFDLASAESAFFRKSCDKEALGAHVMECMSTDMQICRLSCVNSDETSFMMCYSDGLSKHYYWVPLTLCPPPKSHTQ